MMCWSTHGSCTIATSITSTLLAKVASALACTWQKKCGDWNKDADGMTQDRGASSWKESTPESRKTEGRDQNKTCAGSRKTPRIGRVVELSEWVANHRTAEQPSDWSTVRQSNQVAKQPSDWATRQPSDWVAKWPGYQVTGQLSNQATEQPSNQATKQPCNQAAEEQPSNQASKELSNQSANKQPSNQQLSGDGASNQATSKQATDQAIKLSNRAAKQLSATKQLRSTSRSRCN